MNTLTIILVVVVYFRQRLAKTIELAVCLRPDLVLNGNYGPRQDIYLAGDMIYYFCDIGMFLRGNYSRICQDSGHWSGDTPFCDSPKKLNFALSWKNKNTEAGTPLFTKEYPNISLTFDGDQTTCDSPPHADSGELLSWSVDLYRPIFPEIRVFLQNGKGNIEVFALKKNPSPYLRKAYEPLNCGGVDNVAQSQWNIFTCPDVPNIKGVLIKTRRNRLSVCEVDVYERPSYTCGDPHIYIPNGRLKLSRTTATLMCDRGYTRSPDTKLLCIQNVWTRKELYCKDRQWEVKEDYNDP